jgi:hypothetical protein
MRPIRNTTLRNSGIKVDRMDKYKQKGNEDRR